ncbi:glycoside hydrolase family 18 protein, partial [Scleroderma citrinum Foug A]
IATAWYAGWHASDFPVSSINWKNYNTLVYAFAETTPSVNSITLEGSDPDVLPGFVSAAHQNGVSALVGIGGWSGSAYFSSDLGSADNRTAFANTLSNFVQQYNLDGLSFDWEYPGVQAAGQNVVSPMDTSNFLAFLQEFRNTPVGKKLILAASVPVSPFRDAQGNTSKDLSGFAKVLNYITIMDYDIFGSWSSAVGPNAPLADSCAPTQYQQGSATSAVNKWMSTGFPANQIVLGVPSYGHSYRVKSSDAFVNNPTSKLGLSSNELAAYPPFDQNDQPEGDAWGGSAGTFEFWGLIKGGFLDEQGAPAQGIYSRFDSCSQTPYVYNEDSQVMVSYDDRASFSAKGAYIKQNGLRGFSMWEAGGDYQNLLLDAIRLSIGF